MVLSLLLIWLVLFTPYLLEETIQRSFLLVGRSSSIPSLLYPRAWPTPRPLSFSSLQRPLTSFAFHMNASWCCLLAGWLSSSSHVTLQRDAYASSEHWGWLSLEQSKKEQGRSCNVFYDTPDCFSLLANILLVTRVSPIECGWRLPSPQIPEERIIAGHLRSWLP